MLKILELFGGIGACSKALEKLGIDYEIVDYVEIDKYAVKSFNAMHDTNFEPQDICEWNKNIECDLIMHGSPCQDFSIAGLQAGGDEGSGTRSSLMYETLRIVKNLKPKYVIWENVKNLLSKKHKHNFDAYLEAMENLGYKNYYQVLNAKDYGIPQNRERIFTVSIRNDITIDKTVKPSVAVNFEKEKNSIINSDKEIYQCECESGWQDNKVGLKVSPTIRANNNNTFILEDNRHFEFPQKQELKLKLKDMLEDNVDEKYYLSDKKYSEYSLKKIQSNILKKETAGTITANAMQSVNHDNCQLIQVKRIGGIFDTDRSEHQAGSVYDSDGLSPTLDTMQGGWRQPCIEIKDNTKKGYKEAYYGDSINLSYPNSKTRRGRVGKQVSQTLQCNDMMGVVEKTRKDIKEEEKYCEYCDKKLERKRFNGRLEDFTVFKNRKYCNRECMKKDYLKIGDNHKQTYSNAHTTARKINELILHKEECELCGSRTNLDIHHIDGNWQNNNLNNLMCLCRSCHTKYERNKNKTNNELRIRKLTPREVWRLMGFDDEDFEKARKVNSDTQLYKQAGNSIVVNVLMAIFKELLKSKGVNNMSKKVYVDLSQQDVQDIINAYEKDIEKFNKQKEVIDKIKEYLEEDDWASVNGVIAVKLIKEKLNKLLEEIE